MSALKCKVGWVLLVWSAALSCSDSEKRSNKWSNIKDLTSCIWTNSTIEFFFTLNNQIILFLDHKTECK